ncbi:MAG TPA: SDR family oxidoreductase [Chitinophagaceae bacterium]|nr:SDR family oxidoreductase [Chitinophagaceae bacterium]
MSNTILITGASSGIGKAAAVKFSNEGWNVIASMRHPEKEEELRLVKNVFVIKLDVQDAATIELAIREGIHRFGKIDAVINNAGYGQSGIFEAITPEKIQQQFDVNVFGVMNVIRAILPHFRKQKAGMILNISSGAGRFTLPLISLYAASKFALEGFSEALSFELSSLNIIVKIIEPGGTTTNFNRVTQEQFAHDPGLNDYNAFTGAAGKMFDNLRGQTLMTKEAVAAIIYGAATDGSSTLRYVVGNEDFNKRITARATLPDQQYVNTIRDAYTKFMA